MSVIDAGEVSDATVELFEAVHDCIVRHPLYPTTPNGEIVEALCALIAQMMHTKPMAGDDAEASADIAKGFILLYWSRFAVGGNGDE